MDSIVPQLNNDIELIFIDDGSSDNSKDVIENYSLYFDKLIFLPESIGLVKSANIAVKESSANYIMRIDADDWATPNAISQYLDLLKTQNYDCVFPDYFVVDEEGESLYEFKRNKNSINHNFDLPFHGAFTAIKRSFLVEIDFYDEAFNRQDGYFIWLSAIKNSKSLKHIDRPLFSYRSHPTSLSKDLRSLYTTRFEIKKKVFGELYKDISTALIIPLSFSSFGQERVKLIRKIIDYCSSDTIKYSIYIMSDASCKEEVALTNQFSSEVEGVEFRQKSKTYHEQVKSLVSHFELDNFIIAEPDYPLLNLKTISELVLTARIFNWDVVSTILLDTNTYYFHNGEGLNPLTRNSTIRSERNDLYRKAGGLVFYRNMGFLDEQVFDESRHGHVLIDELSSIRVSSYLKTLNFEQ